MLVEKTKKVKLYVIISCIMGYIGKGLGLVCSLALPSTVFSIIARTVFVAALIYNTVNLIYTLVLINKTNAKYGRVDWII